MNDRVKFTWYIEDGMWHVLIKTNEGYYVDGQLVVRYSDGTIS